MISRKDIFNLMHKLHIDDFIRFQKELLRDNRGSFLLPFEVKITDEDFKRYLHLPVEWSFPPLTRKDLPEEFSQNAVKTVDMF